MHLSTQHTRLQAAKMGDWRGCELIAQAAAAAAAARQALM